MKLSELKSAAQVRDEMLTDPDAKAEHDRTAFAHDVALRVLNYRTQRGLSQSALARQLGMKQPAIARLEVGEHEPSLSTLSRLARGLGIAFHVDVTPTALALRPVGQR